MFLTHFSLAGGLISPPPRKSKKQLECPVRALQLSYSMRALFLLKKEPRLVSSPWLPAIIWANEDVVIVRVVLWKMMAPQKYCRSVLSAFPKWAFSLCKLWELSPARDVDNYPWDYGVLFYSTSGNENNSGLLCHTHTLTHYTCSYSHLDLCFLKMALRRAHGWLLGSTFLLF